MQFPYILSQISRCQNIDEMSEPSANWPRIDPKNNQIDNKNKGVLGIILTILRNIQKKRFFSLKIFKKKNRLQIVFIAKFGVFFGFEKT